MVARRKHYLIDGVAYYDCNVCGKPFEYDLTLSRAKCKVCYSAYQKEYHAKRKKANGGKPVVSKAKLACDRQTRSTVMADDFTNKNIPGLMKGVCTPLKEALYSGDFNAFMKLTEVK